MVNVRRHTFQCHPRFATRSSARPLKLPPPRNVPVLGCRRHLCQRPEPPGWWRSEWNGTSAVHTCPEVKRSPARANEQTSPLKTSKVTRQTLPSSDSQTAQTHATNLRLGLVLQLGLRDRVAIRDDDPFEAPLLSQQLAQEPLVATGGHPVHLVFKRSEWPSVLTPRLQVPGIWTYLDPRSTHPSPTFETVLGALGTKCARSC